MYHVTFRGGKIHPPSFNTDRWTRDEIVEKIRSSIGTKLPDGHVVTIDDYGVFELVPRKISMKVELS